MATTTNKPETPKYEWNFVKIPHSQTVVGTKFNATLHGKFNINSTGIHFNNNHQYIDLGIHKDLCFGNLSLCNCGLTIKITIMFTQLEENTVIISSGAEKSSGTGIAMVYRYGQIHCVVSTSTDTWFAAIQRKKLAFHHFHQVIISWSPTHGLKVIVNSHVISTVTTSIKHQSITSSTEHMYIGNPPSVASSSSCNYFMSSVIIWHCWIDSITPPVPGKLYITFSIVGEGEITPPVPGKLYITFSIVGEGGITPPVPGKLYITFSIVGEGEITPPVPGKLYITFSIVGEGGITPPVPGMFYMYIFIVLCKFMTFIRRIHNT
jgi:hypothetical protein